MNIKQLNEDLKSILPFIAKRLTSNIPFQIPTNGAELGAQAKREAAFAAKHKANQIKNAFEKANRMERAKAKSTAGILEGLAKILESSIINLDEEELTEKTEKGESKERIDNDPIDI